eukprot:TRINITY_DN9580_c0_g3_i2.p4 TRINITY_DN9580_c0_g3~~TRINITY_DN9580_c0_g3_i2.p4  ORF type:complete len:101 (+),score=2.24 TRINITY_DN9580_c0_g3_i2:534-836(+)
MLAGFSYVIFAIVFGILVDRFDHINNVIDVHVRQEGGNLKTLASMKASYDTFDELFVMKCVHWCYEGKTGMLQDYMLPQASNYPNGLFGAMTTFEGTELR